MTKGWQSTFMMLALAGALAVPNGLAQSQGSADAFLDRVEELVKTYYPAASFSRGKNQLIFSHETRKFMIHTALKTGEWQAANEVEGPKRHGGVLGELEVRPGRWAGAAVVPQTFDQQYFTTYVMAPYAEGCDCHLVADLHYPDTVDGDFIERWTRLINEFPTVMAGQANERDGNT